MSLCSLKPFQKFLTHKHKLHFPSHVPQDSARSIPDLISCHFAHIHFGQATTVISWIKEQNSFPSISGPLHTNP